MTTDPKHIPQRPKAVAVRRALRKYLAWVAASAPGDEADLAKSIIKVQTLAAQFDEADASIWGGK